jgi:hypothetical protein
MPAELPTAGGSQGVGVVTAIGSNVSGVSVGDNVVPTKSGLGNWFSLANTGPSDNVSQERGEQSSLLMNPAFKLFQLESMRSWHHLSLPHALHSV